MANVINISDKTVRKIILDLYVKDKKTLGPKKIIPNKDKTKIKQIVNRRFIEKKKPTQDMFGIDVT